MFTIIPSKSTYIGDGKSLVQATCKSADEKPTDGIANGSIVLEMDTSTFYAFDEAGGEWLALE